MLKKDDLLPEACFCDEKDSQGNFTVDFQRILYNCENLLDKKFTNGSKDIVMIPKTSGVQRVVVHQGFYETLDKATLVSNTGLQTSEFVYNPTLRASEGVIGYINCEDDKMFTKNSLFTLYKDYKCTVPIPAPENWRGTNTSDDKITVSGDYLTKMHTPFIITVYRSGVDIYKIPDDDFGHGLNFYGSGIWAPGSYDSDSETIFIGTGNAQIIPFEEDLRMMRHSLIATKGQTWVDDNLGPYGDEHDLWIGTYARWTEDGNHLADTACMFPGSICDSYLPDISGKFPAYGYDESSPCEPQFNSASATTLRRRAQKTLVDIYKTPKSARMRRQLHNSIIAINARNGGLEWADQLTPQDSYSVHQGLVGKHDRLSSQFKCFAGLNCDNACGMMIATDKDGKKTGYTAWKTGMHAFYDISKKTNTIGVNNDTSFGLDEGVSYMDVPCLKDSSKKLDETINTGYPGINEEGWGALDYLPLGMNGSPPMNYWGHCAADETYIYASRLSNSFFSTQNNILHTRNDAGELIRKYDNLSLDEVKKMVPPWASDRIVKFENYFAVVWGYSPYAPFLSILNITTPTLCFGLYTHSGEWVWDVIHPLEEHKAVPEEGGMLSTFGATLLPGGIMSVGTPLSKLLWVNVQNGDLVHTQKFMGNSPPYVGALINDGGEYVLPLSGKFLQPHGKLNRMIQMFTPGGL